MANEVAHHIADTTMQAIVSKTPYVAAGITIFGATLSEWLQIFGIISIPLTLLLNWHFQNQRNKILREAVKAGVTINHNHDKGM